MNLGGRRVIHFGSGSKISHTLEAFTFLFELALKTNCIQLDVMEMFSSFSLFVLVFVLLWVEEIMAFC